MNGVVSTLSAAILFGLAVSAQVSPQPGNRPNPPVPAPADAALSPGTILSVELSKSLDAKKLKANDKVEVRTVVDLLSHGQIVIPRNTKIIGRVTEAKAHSKQSPDSIVGIVFERVLLKEGRAVPLQAFVQAIARPLQTAPAFPGEDPMAATAGGMPSVSQSQRGTMAGTGSTAAGTPFPNPGGYPPGGGSGLPSDPASGSSTVSPLGPTSKGVVGIKGLTLDSSGLASVVSSKTDNVRLDGGTQLILRVQ